MHLIGAVIEVVQEIAAEQLPLHRIVPPAGNEGRGSVVYLVVDRYVPAQQLMISFFAFPVRVQLVPGDMDILEILHRARGFLIAPQRLFPELAFQQLASGRFLQILHIFGGELQFQRHAVFQQSFQRNIRGLVIRRVLFVVFPVVFEIGAADARQHLFLRLILPPGAFIVFLPVGIVSGVGGLSLFLIIEKIVVAVPVFVIVECGLFCFLSLFRHRTASFPMG